jgi:hypothetical protein
LEISGGAASAFKNSVLQKSLPAKITFKIVWIDAPTRFGESESVTVDLQRVAADPGLPEFVAVAGFENPDLPEHIGKISLH